MTQAYLGRSVAGAGDVNDDGISDILIAAPQGDGTGGTGIDTGNIFVKFGSPNLTGTLIAWESADLTILGKTSGQKLGRSMGRVTR